MTFKQKSLLKIGVLYLFIALSGTIALMMMRDLNMKWAFLWADVVMTLVCFAGALLFKNASAYDAYWSVIPFYFIVAWGVIFKSEIDLNGVLIALVVSLWSWRLTLNWVRSWPGMDHEDYRYIDLKKKSGKAYPLVNFFGIHLFPTVMVFGCMLPLFAYFENEAKDGSVFLLGILLALIGVLLEWKADNELYAFRKKGKKGAILDTGIWGVVRHPNYLGEMTFWSGIALVGVAYVAPWYSYIGVLALIAMFLFVTIPMKEERMSKKPGFDAYKQKVSKCIPFV